MTDSYTGGCACGSIRFEIRDEPIAMGDCQCRDCQHRSGTGHGSYLTFPSRAKVTLNGEARTWQVTGDAGTLKQHAFCGECGSPVFLTLPAHAPDLFIIHAASLDDPGRYKPQFMTYAVRGHSWDAIDPAVERFERMPPAQS